MQAKTTQSAPASQAGVPLSIPLQVQRDALLEQILSLVRASQLDRPETVERPSIAILNSRIYYRGDCLDLASKPMSLKLFKAFVKTPNRMLTRDQVIQEIYGVEVGPHMSQRRVESMACNAVKLVSRTRLMANTHLSCEGKARWFVRNHLGWELVQNLH